MKRKLSISICLFLALILTACGNKGKENEFDSVSGVEIKNETYGNNRESRLEEDEEDLYEVPIFNVIRVANKNQREVEEVLGIPDEMLEEEFTYIDTGDLATSCIRGEYTEDNLKVSVLFVDGSSRQIIIRDKNKNKEKFVPSNILRKIGLDEKPYTSRFRNNICWQNVYVLYEISIEEDISAGEICTTIITDERFR